MGFLKNIDMKMKITISTLSIIGIMFGSLFFMEDRWNQTMSVAMAREEVKEVEKDVIDSLKALNKKIDATNLSSQYSTIKLLQLQNKTNLKQNPGDKDFLKIEEQLIEEEKRVVNELVNTGDSY
jgi:hypothetical protein